MDCHGLTSTLCHCAAGMMQCQSGGCTSVSGYFGAPVSGLTGITAFQNVGDTSGTLSTVSCTAPYVVLGGATAQYDNSTALPYVAKLIRIGCGTPQICTPPPPPPLPPPPPPLPPAPPRCLLAYALYG